MADIERVGATDPIKARQMYTEYWKTRQERLNKYLTAEQQNIWLEMIGDPYSFQYQTGQ